MKCRFNERDYLAANPDAARDVAEGMVRSAWAHFLGGAYLEARQGVPDAFRASVRAVMKEALPVPPQKVLAGRPAAEVALGDKLLGLGVYAAAAPVLDLAGRLRILDFGCGYGRLAGALFAAAPRSLIHCVDTDAEAVGWCERSLRDVTRSVDCSFAVIGDPPLPFRAGYFDLVCGVSIFASMPERRQLLWLSELRRVTRPEGFLVLSGLQGTAEKYFAVVDEIPSSVTGHRDLVLYIRHPALVL